MAALRRQNSRGRETAIPTYFRFGIGPFRVSQRLGRTQAQKRAAAKAQQQRARQCEFNRMHTETVEYLYTTQGTDSEVAVFGRENPAERELYLHLRQGPVPVPEGTWVTISYQGGNLVGIGPADVPASVVARKAAQADRDARTYRAAITGCSIDPLKGGEFTVKAEGRPELHITVEPDMALTFLSLKNGDIVEVMMNREGTGLEVFRHLRRANGSTPRKQVGFSEGRWGVW